jgi:hypothetical protein
MKVRSKDAADTPASFALLFVQNYAILDLSDKISSGRWWIPKCSFFTALKSDNALYIIIIYVPVPSLDRRLIATMCCTLQVLEHTTSTPHP